MFVCTEKGERDGLFMKREDILNSIIQIMEEILDLTVNEKVQEEESIQSAGIDSIGLMTIIVYLEEKYKIEIQSENFIGGDYSKITFSNLIDAVENSFNYGE